jgi:hypothetical protein
MKSQMPRRFEELFSPHKSLDEWKMNPVIEKTNILDFNGLFIGIFERT